ncbi:MAG TPA: cytochrome ubiquinol oxidase subunit I [Casimicrobiaceae bacterium]|nr:cytochrome ubiquinol oxidase subunit I [Casimicrobiaceae bacterium]
MEALDTLVLSRIQFGTNIAFHILFPTINIALCWFLVYFRLRHDAARGTPAARAWEEAYYLWTKVFALSFALGVVSGITMSFQFGTNWPGYMERVGNIAGPLLGYEVLTAFFLEATFLGILLFGWHRVPRWLHVTAAILVAIGTSISAFWILSANSWMHTPAGHVVRDGVAYPVDWLQVIFNPSFPYRFVHMLTACYLTTSLVVLAVGARYIIAKQFDEEARTMMRMGLGMVALLAPFQLLVGDLHGLNTLQHQPAKIAAMEAHWDGAHPAGLVLFAWPDSKNERNLAEISIPNVASLILTHEWEGTLKGLKDFPRNERPPVAPVFFAFRAMVGIGFVMIAIGLIGAWLWWKGRLFETHWFLKPVGYTWPLGFLAILSGWIVTEVGRQPWIAHGILRTADAASPVSANAVALSFAAIVITYSVVFTIGVWYMRKMIQKGPVPGLLDPPAGVANRPLSAANEAAAHAKTGEAAI